MLRAIDGEARVSFEQWFDIELTYTSDALEGNTLTCSETVIVVEKCITVRGKPLKDHEDAVNYYGAVRFVRALLVDPRSLLESDVRDIRRLIVARTESGKAVCYSQERRYISGSKVVLPAPEKILSLMQTFGDWLKAAEPTPLNVIKVHYDLVRIHSFFDRNGRTARLLINLLLMYGGYPPMIIHPEDRPDYADSLEQVHMTDDLTGYDFFMLERLDASLDQCLEMVRA